MATKAAPKPPRKRSTERGNRINITLDARRTNQLEQIVRVFGVDPSSAISDCVARRHLELKKEFPNEFD